MAAKGIVNVYAISVGPARAHGRTQTADHSQDGPADNPPRNAAESNPWDENRVFLEGDKLEVEIKAAAGC